MTELYLSYDHYRELVTRLLPIAGAGNADQIKAVLGPMASERLARLADHLANLQPCPVTGAITRNEVVTCLGEHGDIWPREIYGPVVIANLEQLEKQRAMACHGENSCR
jgi:hypothetical protein